MRIDRFWKASESMIVDPLYSRLGSNIRRHREKMNWSQDRLARAVGISRASVTNIEVGRQRTSLERLYKIAASLATNPRDLLPEVGFQLAGLPPELPKAAKQKIQNKIREAKQ